MAKKHYTPITNGARMPKPHDSNHHTPEALLACTTNDHVQSKSHPPSASLSRRHVNLGRVSMHQTSLEESLHNGLLEDAQLTLAKVIYFLGIVM